MFNHYRFKRKIGKQVKSLSNFVSHNIGHTSFYDFAWHKTKQNPLWLSKAPKYKEIIEVSAIFLATIISILIIIFHPFFRINTITVSDNQRLDKFKISETSLLAIDYKYHYFLPGNNYFLMSQDYLAYILKNRFPIESLKITKQFPNRLNIVIQEKPAQIIYSDGKRYYYLSDNGIAIETLKNVGDKEWPKQAPTVTSVTSSTSSTVMNSATNTSTNSITENIDTKELLKYVPINSLKQNYGDLPIVCDLTTKQIEINSSTLSNETAQAVVTWTSKLKENLKISINLIVVKDDFDYLYIETGEGYELRVTTSNIEEQIKDLKLVLKEKIKNTKINYIDLRFRDHVYWQ